jgi:hypothetical protein
MRWILFPLVGDSCFFLPVRQSFKDLGIFSIKLSLPISSSELHFKHNLTALENPVRVYRSGINQTNPHQFYVKIIIFIPV